MIFMFQIATGILLALTGSAIAFGEVRSFLGVVIIALPSLDHDIRAAGRG